MEDVRNATSGYPGVQITIDKEQNGPPVGKPINIEITGDDFDRLIAISERVKTMIEESNIQGIEELKSDLETGKTGDTGEY
jgi:multidrug efflux pump